MGAGFFANEVYETNSTSVTPSAVANCDPAGIVPSTLFTQGDGELSDGSTFPKMRVQRATKVSDAGGDGFVSFVERRSPGEGLRDGCSGIERDFGSIVSKP